MLVAHLIAVVNVCFAAHGVAVFGGWRAGAPLPSNGEGVFVYTGELAVQYFFVLSGFVMMTAHHADFGKAGAVWRFWRRRASRIYPVYWLAILIALGAGHLPHTSFGGALQTLGLAPWQTDFIIFPSWSLRFEVAFYLVFGLCLLPRIGKPLLCLWVGFCIWRWCPVALLQSAHLFSMALFSLFPPADSNRFVSPMEFYFFAGLAAGAIFIWARPGKVASALLLAGGAVLLLQVLPPLRDGGPYIASPMGVLRLGLIIGAMVLGLAGLERAGVFRPKPGWRRFGAISYPLYILHMPILSLVVNRLPGVRFTNLAALYLTFALLLAVIYGFAAAATRVFDQPIQRWLRARWA